MPARWRFPWRTITRGELRARGMTPMPVEIKPDSPVPEPESPRCERCLWSPRGFCEDHRKSYNVLKSVDAGRRESRIRWEKVM